MIYLSLRGGKTWTVSTILSVIEEIVVSAISHHLMNTDKPHHRSGRLVISSTRYLIFRDDLNICLFASNVISKVLNILDGPKICLLAQLSFCFPFGSLVYGLSLFQTGQLDTKDAKLQLESNPKGTLIYKLWYKQHLEYVYYICNGYMYECMCMCLCLCLCILFLHKNGSLREMINLTLNVIGIIWLYYKGWSKKFSGSRSRYERCQQERWC